MDLSVLLEESSSHVLCYVAMGKLRPQSCSVEHMLLPFFAEKIYYGDNGRPDFSIFY